MVQLARIFAGTEGPMEKEIGLWGSFLHHREDIIPDLGPLLAPVLNF